MGLNPCCSGRWARTNVVLEGKSREFIVLILVVVEDGLVLVSMQANQLDEMDVLILVVVEDGLVPIYPASGKIARVAVLILVVVEDGLVLV